jgi:outer membrane receptor for ferric coprogen and ferric-rhodotorulic acid
LRAPLALAISGLALALHVQVASAQPVRFDIAAQPLATALDQFARQAGLQLVFAPQLAQGRQAPAVQGAHEVRQALDALLRGSGLAGHVEGGTLTVERVAAAQPALGAVTVTAQAERDGTTEGTGSYQATATNTSTKLTLTPRETPQTVTVISLQQMDDAGMTSVDDALKATSGVYMYDRGGNGSIYYSRGFEMQSQYDGMAAPAGISEWNRAPQVDRAFLDRVEVLQGAAGLLAGAGQPGGTINMVRKRPTESFQGQAEVQLGSWNQRRMVADLSGSLAVSGRVRGRLVAVADDSGSFVDYVFRDRRAIYGIVEADLTPDTLLSASVQHQRDKGRTHFGVPFAADGSDAGLPRSMFVGDANYRQEKDVTHYTLGLTQRLAGDWSLKAAYSHQETGNAIQNYSYASGSLNPVTGDGLALGRQRAFDRGTRTHALDVHATGPFDLLGRTHELVVGVNASAYRDAWQGSGYPANTPVNMHTFDPTALGPVPEGGSPYTGAEKIEQLGLFGVARWSLADALKLITGARISQYESRNPLTGATNLKESSVFSPYAGLVYDLNAQYSVYASYSDIFDPQSSKSADGSTLKPVVGANYELGIKGELLDKRLNVSAAVFRLVQSNLARVDDSVEPDPSNPCGGTCYIAADKVTSQGVDLGVNGQVGRGVNLAAGYTYTSSEYAAGDQKGERYRTDAPRHSLRLAANYQLSGTGWSVGGNLAATSKTYKASSSAADPWTIRNGALVLVGLHPKYRITPQAELLLAVSNLTDRSYRNLEGRNYASFGEPRKFTANLKYRF